MAKYQRYLDLIASAEAPGENGYRTGYGGTLMPEGLTIQQAMEWAAENRKKKGSSAFGRYQFMPKTMQGLITNRGVDPNAPFSPEMQDTLAGYLLEDRGIKQFEAGKKSPDEMAYDLSQEWAGLPSGPHGKSYYADDGVNKATVPWDSVIGALGSTDGITSSLAPPPAEAATQQMGQQQISPGMMQMMQLLSGEAPAEDQSLGRQVSSNPWLQMGLGILGGGGGAHPMQGIAQGMEAGIGSLRKDELLQNQKEQQRLQQQAMQQRLMSSMMGGMPKDERTANMKDYDRRAKLVQQFGEDSEQVKQFDGYVLSQKDPNWGQKMAHAQTQGKGFDQKISDAVSDLDSINTMRRNVLNTSDTIKKTFAEAGASGWESLISSIPGSDSRRLDGLLKTFKANVAFDKIANMKADSQAGATGLGPVAVPEFQALQQSLARLDQASTEEQLKADLITAFKAYKTFDETLVKKNNEILAYYKRYNNPEDMARPSTRTFEPMSASDIFGGIRNKVGGGTSASTAPSAGGDRTYVWGSGR